MGSTIEESAGTVAPQQSAQTRQNGGQYDEADTATQPLPQALAQPGMKKTRRGRAKGVKGGREDAARQPDRTDLITLRDRQILAMRLAQTPIKDIQKRFGISRQTVYRSLTMAQRRAFNDFALDNILEQLMPKALAALDMALDAGDSEVALKVLEGVGILGKKVVVESLPPGTESFEEYRRHIIRTGQAPDGTGSHPAGDPDSADSAPALPAAQTEALPIETVVVEGVFEVSEGSEREPSA